MKGDVAMDVGLSDCLDAPVERPLHGGDGCGKNHGVERDGPILRALGVDLQANFRAIDGGGGAAEVVGVLFRNQTRTV